MKRFLRNTAHASLMTALVLGSSAAHARGLDVSISGETLKLGLFSQTSQLVRGGADVGVNLLINDASDVMLTGSMVAIGEPPRQGAPYQFGVGAKAYLGALDVGENLAGIGVGGQVNFVVPNNVSPVGLVFEAFIAPGLTAFGDSEQITELGARIEVEVTPSASGYIGIRNFEVDFDDKTVTVDDNVHFGVRINF